MRRSVFSAVLAASLTLFACSEQPTEVPSRPEAIPLNPAPRNAVSCTLADVLRLASNLFPPGPIRTAILALVNKLPPNLPQRHSLAARRAIFPIVDALLKAFYAGKLYGGTSAETFNNVLRLIEALYCYVGATPPSLPGPTSGTGPGSDAVVRVVFPGVATTVCTPSGDGALFVSNTSVTTAMGPVTIVIYDLPDTPPPLRTSLDQYPRFYHYSGVTATGTVEFATPVTAAVSPRAPITGEVSLRLAHNVEPNNFGGVEVLPPPAAIPVCPTPIGATRGGELGRFAWAEKLFLPTELHAASAVLYELPPVGGTTKKFSEFGIVDVSSNPGRLAPVGSTETTEEGGTVTRTVLVTSDNGTPIRAVPVTFTTEEGNGAVLTPQPVFTGEDGKASVSWALPTDPGTYTLAVEVPFYDNEPLGTTNPPTSNISSTPDVAFDPQSLTLTATVPAPEVIITLAGPPTLCEGIPATCGGAFIQDGYQVQSFWLSGAGSEPQGAVLQTFPGHFHMVDLTTGIFHGFEAHHLQHNFDRQGFRISRAEGGTFTLHSIEYRPRDAGTPFEIGTSPITSIVTDETYVTLASGYTPFPAPPSASFTFQTLTFSGFENVTEVYITMRGSADWRNVVLTQAPGPVLSLRR